MAHFLLPRLQAIIPHSILSTCLASAVALLPCPSQAQSSPAPDDSHFLWQVESPTNTVYLLGSIHFLSAENFPLPAAIEAAFDDAEVVVLEVDVGTNDGMDAALVMLNKAQPEPGEALDEVLSPETYELAGQRTAELGLPIEVFRAYEPWFLAVSLTTFKLMSLGFTPDYGLDRYFYQQAQAADKPILYLETLEQQANLFEQLSIEEQRQFVLQTLDELDVMEESFNSIVAAWSTGDVDGMADILLTSFADYPQMEAVFLRDRNQNWSPQIESFLGQEDDYLVVVGALHLAGPDSLIRLLGQQGYTAEQL